LLSIWIPIGSRFRHRSASSLSHRSLCPINQWCLPLPIFNY
jgi:hypothetical protein